MLQNTFIPFDEVGAFSCGNTLAVDENAAVSFTVTAGKKVVILMNTGSKAAWFGGSDVDPATSKGVKQGPQVMLIFRNVKSTFKVYYKMGAGDTTNISIVETD